ncbi:hypothetical protein KM043_005328 [Ampulex compressa]|nr:hypothetical protein KM043_005328 [Ampulex compressa]
MLIFTSACTLQPPLGGTCGQPSHLGTTEALLYSFFISSPSIRLYPGSEFPFVCNGESRKDGEAGRPREKKKKKKKKKKKMKKKKDEEEEQEEEEKRAGRGPGVPWEQRKATKAR